MVGEIQKLGIFCLSFDGSISWKSATILNGFKSADFVAVLRKNSEMASKSRFLSPKN